MRNILLLVFIVLNFVVFGQIYSHDFGTTAITTNPYTTAPISIDANLNTSQWSTSNTSFVDFAGSVGKALSITLSSAGNKTYSLTFNINSGYSVDISSFSFWKRRSTSGPTSWSLTINSISVGGGSLSGTTGSDIGLTNVSNVVQDIRTSVTVVITLYGGASGSTFRLDDFKLNGTVLAILPITLTSYTGQKEKDYNLLEWSTATELNNDYFLLESSEDCIVWNTISKTKGAGNSIESNYYSYSDYFYNSINYYRLSQVDYDGSSEVFGIIYIDNTKLSKKVIRVINFNGQEVPIDTKGLLIVTYDDGSTIRIMN